ncbi:Spermidine/putrescine import ATP-binding protein PotA [Sinobacterium norvegicum]|uniref:Spermidine/putrescine import ATP-binding protein PotA n=1 Tax=Sinobacterium norvegicum TaxID=1641715 RepID=A0ABN8EFZ2_9GAMM|nr:polyamine ABC transporter ATP-binding protein [Sinobacterium norvegicum]CAH0990090.1 Spermidine/putrescine import ATP-binding protein PotA [Sinobacterium norvegicum]
MSDGSSNQREVCLQIKNVSKNFDDFTAVDNVSLDIYKGEIFALLGASGCGKSTLLRMMAGFENLSAGHMILDGDDLREMPPYQRPINMMFQSYALFPHMTVEQNIAFGLKQDKMPKALIRDKVDHVLGMVQMTKFAKRKPHQLSGGQRQRVALARSLAKEPKLLLLDEPMGALDKKLRTRMQLEVAEIIENVGVTCVMVTHDQEEAMTMADRVGIMHKGIIRQVGSPHSVYEQPNSRYTAEFIGSANVFDGKLVVDERDHVEIDSPSLSSNILVGHGVAGRMGMDLAYAIRPEKISISKTKPDQTYNVAKGVVEEIAYLGSHSIYHVKLSSGFIVMVQSSNSHRRIVGDGEDAAITWEDEVYINWEQNSGVVLIS